MAIELELIENNSKKLEDALNEEMQKPIKHFETELLKIRTGRAHSSLIEDVLVVCYGQPPAPLRNYATISTPEARLLVVQPWDVSIIPDIEKALLNSDAGVNPVNDGKIIRIQLPQVSADRREELIKQLHKKLEECRVAIRNIRKEFNNLIRDAKKNSKISENFFNRLEEIVQKITDKFIALAEEKSEKKEKDVKTV